MLAPRRQRAADDRPNTFYRAKAPGVRRKHRTRIAADEAGVPLAEGARLSIVLAPLGLIAGRVGIGSLTLDGARLTLPEDGTWTGPLRRVAERVRAGGALRPHRVVLKDAVLVRPGRDEPEITDLDLDLDWPAWATSLDGTASFTWRGLPSSTWLTWASAASRRRSKGSSRSGVADMWLGSSLAAHRSAMHA